VGFGGQRSEFRIRLMEESRLHAGNDARGKLPAPKA
jgi:hypothetical protein